MGGKERVREEARAVGLCAQVHLDADPLRGQGPEDLLLQQDGAGDAEARRGAADAAVARLLDELDRGEGLDVVLLRGYRRGKGR